MMIIRIAVAFNIIRKCHARSADGTEPFVQSMMGVGQWKETVDLLL